jgi:uncharacterized protein YhjY with autotransporter beta-barrel domain
MPLELFLCIRLTRLVEHGDIQPFSHICYRAEHFQHISKHQVALEIMRFHRILALSGSFLNKAVSLKKKELTVSHALTCS